MARQSVAEYMLLFFCVVGLSFAAIGFAYDGELYRNDQYFFSIKIPKGWNIEKGRNPHVVIKALNDTRNVSVSVTVQALSPEEIGRQITELVTAQDITEGYKRNGAHAVLLDSGTTKIWNEQALWVNNLLSISHLGRTVHTVQYQVVTYHRGYMYSFLVGAGSDTQSEALRLFDRFEPEFQQALASFAFEDWRRPDSGKTPTQEPVSSGKEQPLWPGPIENFTPQRQSAPVQPAAPAEPPADVKGKPGTVDNPFEEGYQQILKERREEELINDCLLKYQKTAKCNRSAQIINLVCNCMFRESCPDMNQSVCKCLLDNIPEAQADTAANSILKACKGKNK
jgi:hypothetical protein